ncbi:MAG: hypothetical protein LBE86_10850, partial [Gemmobacter sp.]|nr:hypothetical protein [Gemmobacter sp.]
MERSLKAAIHANPRRYPPTINICAYTLPPARAHAAKPQKLRAKSRRQLPYEYLGKKQCIFASCPNTPAG